MTAAESPSEAERLLRSEGYDVLLTGLSLHGAAGVELLRCSGRLEYPPLCIALGDVVPESAFDCLPYPFTEAQFRHLLEKVHTVVELKAENQRLKKALARPSFFSGMTSPGMIELQYFVDRVAPTESSVLLLGEPGTGKSELARIIRARSPRALGSFVIVNCANLAQTSLESKLALAGGGTLFLDEIAELSLDAQSSLLKCLEERTIDVRMIAATNCNFEEAAERGGFVQELFLLLKPLQCRLPPLRSRREDLPVLIQRMILEVSEFSDTRQIKRVPAPVMRSLLAYSWPGNLRQLRDTIERVMTLSAGREILLADLPDALREGGASPSPAWTGPSTLEELERAHIEKVLSIAESQEDAAEMLGITTVTLWRKRKQYGLP